MSLLTIYVPTFDRPNELDRLLASIPYSEGVTVIVADDSGTRRFENTAVGQGVSYVSRAYNQGRDVNLLMAVAECRSEWLWVIGDDDWLLEGALGAVLEEIARDRADRIITYSTASEHRIPTDLRGEVLRDAEVIDRLRPADPSLLIATTLCSANVFRTSTLDLAEGARHFDTYYAYAWASLRSSRWVILDKPTIGVGTDHAQTIPNALEIWQDYLDGMCREAGVAPVSVQQAARWNFVSVEPRE
jgi:glycosyltransferase involved in cell wall biosynthesis